MAETARELICKSYTVNGQVIRPTYIANAIEALGNAPASFSAGVLAKHLLPYGEGWDQDEACNRIMQRWRKLGLCEFKSKGWRLTTGAWEKLQLAAAEAWHGDAT